MNETTDPNNQILLVAIIALYWAMLSSWNQLLSRRNDERAKRPTPSATLDVAIAPTISLDSLREIDPQFGPASFLEGAKRAYEAILQAYAEGNIQALDHLVGPEVLDVFKREVAGRRDRQETLQLTFIGTRAAEIIDVFVEDNAAEIVVRYVSDMISVTRSANDAIAAGDPRQIVEVTDIWTFACELRSAKRNWLLIATEAG